MHGTGNDRVVDEPGRLFARIHVNLGHGNDRMTVVDHGGTIRASGGDDTILVASDGWPLISPGAGDLIRVAPEAGSGSRWGLCVHFGTATGPVRVNLALGRATGQGRDRLVNMRCVIGSRFNDVLTGTELGDWIEVGGGLTWCAPEPATTTFTAVVGREVIWV